MRINTDKLGALGWILAILAIIFFVIVGFSSCSTTRYVPVKDSTTEVKQIEHHDTIKVNQRIVYVDVPLPFVKYVNITRDTSSTLSDGLYKSTASIKNGILSHTLFTVLNAHLNAKVDVQDTTKTSNTKVDDNKTSKINVPYPIIKYKYVDKPLSWWKSTVMKVGYAGLVAILIALSYGGFKLYKKFNINSIISKIIRK